MAGLGSDLGDAVFDRQQPFPEKALKDRLDGRPVDQLQHEEVRLEKQNGKTQFRTEIYFRILLNAIGEIGFAELRSVF